MDRTVLLKVLRDEIERSVGCTDPGAVCLAVHEATHALGQKPSQVTVTVSPNIYKNGISVGVPGTGMRGLHIAAALGAVIGPGPPACRCSTGRRKTIWQPPAILRSEAA
jgi:L-cysteine desulfidase